MEKLKNNKINGIIVIIAFVFNILIFAPIEIYYTNQSELWFNIKDMLPIIIPLAVLAITLFILPVIKIKGKKQRILVTIVFVLTIGLYIQGNFLNFGYNKLDGENINWNSMIVKGIINTIIWLIFIVIPIVFQKLKKEETFKLISSIISIFIVLIEIITLTTLVITNNGIKETEEKGLRNSNIFNLSKKENIVVFMSDTFEGTYMNKILEEYPEYKEKLSDFTYFDNCTGVSFFTYSSMPTLLTGVECQVGNTLDENLDYCFENTDLYKVLKENGYSTEIYTEKALTPTNTEQIDNLNTNTDVITTVETKGKIVEKMYKYVLYRYLPHFLKPKFVVTSDEFNNIKSEDISLSYKDKTYFLDDVVFNNVLTTGEITTNDAKKSFKFYQTNGMHIPYNTTADLKYDETKEYNGKDEKERRYNEAIASLNLLCNYIEELKKAGIYEQTTIIFLADHGYDNRFYTNLIVKKANEEHEFKISSAPVTLKDDLIPTILNIATNSKEYGKDFFDYEEGEKRIRQVGDYTYETNYSIIGKNRYEVLSKMTFQSEDKAKEKEKFYVVDEEYFNEEKKLTEKYTFGTTIPVNEIEESKCINLVGFNLKRLNVKVSEGCNISRNTYLKVNRLKTNNDVTILLNLEKVFNNKQTINFKIGKEKIYSCVVEAKGEKNIKFIIPKEIWNKNEEVIIEIEFPDAQLGDEHATMMTAIKLKSITFKK